MLKIIEEKIALDDPSYLEIIGKLYWRLLITKKKVLFKFRIRLTLHKSKTLKTSAFINWKDEYNMIRVFKGIS